MVKKSLSILLLLAFFSYQAYHSLIYLNYYIRLDYYKNVLCENKNNPDKPACNGKCHLNKQLAQQKPDEPTHPFSKSTGSTFYPELIGILIQKQSINLFDNLDLNKIAGFPHSFSQAHLGSVFHPPDSDI